jgi:SAM-dependent MidA family methyltransferase
MNSISNQPSSLPIPEPAARSQSEALTQNICQMIETAGGWLPFSTYMHAALYTPGLGYYSGGATKLGHAGDFTTAPELSPLFGQTLAQPIAETLAELKVQGHSSEILEVGAGTGKLAAALLLELAHLEQLPERYAILDVSAELRERQAETLRTAFIEAQCPELFTRVYWLNTLPEHFSGVIVGNEVLDAMPVDLWAWHKNEGWTERGVIRKNDHFQWIDRSVSGHFLPAAEAEYLTENHAAAEGFIHSLASILSAGLILMIDYGFPQAEYYHPQRTQGTFMGHYRHHAHHDPFLYPGLSDLTAHVNFSGIARAGLEAGLSLLGYASQGRFLLNAGITEVLMRLDPRDAKTFLPASNAAQKLLSEAEMGELFKVIALGKKVSGLNAFTRADRSDNLWNLATEACVPPHTKLLTLNLNSPLR